MRKDRTVCEITDTPESALHYSLSLSLSLSLSPSVFSSSSFFFFFFFSQTTAPKAKKTLTLNHQPEIQSEPERGAGERKERKESPE